MKALSMMFNALFTLTLILCCMNPDGAMGRISGKKKKTKKTVVNANADELFKRIKKENPNVKAVEKILKSCNSKCDEFVVTSALFDNCRENHLDPDRIRLFSIRLLYTTDDNVSYHGVFSTTVSLGVVEEHLILVRPNKFSNYYSWCNMTGAQSTTVATGSYRNALHQRTQAMIEDRGVGHF